MRRLFVAGPLFRRLLVAGALCACAGAPAQTPQSPLPEDLFKHLYWTATGDHTNEALAAGGMDYIGRLNDTILHAYTMVRDGRACLIYNTSPADTVCRYRFPGQKVIRGRFRGGPYVDYACWDNGLQRITVLYGTASPSVFDTALILQGSGQSLKYPNNAFCVADVDSDSFEDLIVSDETYNENALGYGGRVMCFRGGPRMDSLPSYLLLGETYPNQTGGYVAVGNVRGGSRRYLCELRSYGRVAQSDYDTLKLYLYPLGPGFRLVATDTCVLTWDLARYGPYTFGFALFDVDGDSIPDVEVSVYDNDYKPGLQADPCVAAYKGGDTIGPHPTYYFHRPYETYSAQFGMKIVDLGTVSSRDYHTILITDPDASLSGLSSGAVFLFNIGPAMRDACVGYAMGPQRDYETFGMQAIPLGDLDNDGLAEFAVAADVDSFSVHEDIGSVGAIYVFHGSAKYVDVEEPPLVPGATDSVWNYPNPFSTATIVSFSLRRDASDNLPITLSVCDLLGREVARLYHGRAHLPGTSVVFPAGELPAGSYVLRLARGASVATRILQIVR